MRFGLVPQIAVDARPWAQVVDIGPPVGTDINDCGFLQAQTDDVTKFAGVNVRVYRCFAELEDGDLERIQAGHPIEVVLWAKQMVPISVAVW